MSGIMLDYTHKMKMASDLNPVLCMFPSLVQEVLERHFNHCLKELLKKTKMVKENLL